MAMPSAEATAGSFTKAQKLKERAAINTVRAYGTSRFLTPEEIEDAGLYDPVFGGRRQPILAGRSLDGRPIRYGGDGHIQTFGPNGSGKSVSVVVPNVLSYPGTVVVIDPKGAIAPITVRQRLRFGDVKVFDPFREIKDPAFDALRTSYNPLDFLDPAAPTLLDDIRMISSALVIGEMDKNKFFSDSARTILETIILYVLAALDKEHWTLRTVVDLAYQSPERYEKQLLPEMQESDAFGGLLAQLANQVAGFGGDAGLNVWSTLRRSLNFLQSPLLMEALEPSDVNFRALKGDRPLTIYLVLPAMRLDAYGRWLRLMLSLMLASILDTRQPDYPVLFMLDEAAALDRLEMIETGIALYRGFGIKLWLLWQDLSQLRSVYQNRWPTFIANSGLRQFFNVNDWDTAEYVSRMMGNGTIEVLNESIQPGAQAAGSVGVISRPVLTPDEVARLSGDDLLLLYDRLMPIQARKLVYYDKTTNPEFDGLYDPDPYRRKH